MAPVPHNLTGDQVQRLAKAADAAWPAECCGVVLQGGHVVVLPNRLPHPDDLRAFDVDPGDLARALQGCGWGAVTHVFHSHPRHAHAPGTGGGSPSEADVVGHPVGVVMVVVDGDGVPHGWAHPGWVPVAGRAPYDAPTAASDARSHAREGPAAPPRP